MFQSESSSVHSTGDTSSNASSLDPSIGGSRVISMAEHVLRNFGSEVFSSAVIDCLRGLAFLAVFVLFNPSWFCTFKCNN